jgi:hypothetical protein
MDEMSYVGIRKKCKRDVASGLHLDEQPVTITMRMHKAISNLRWGGGLPRRYKALGMPPWTLIEGEATHV